MNFRAAWVLLCLSVVPVLNADEQTTEESTSPNGKYQLVFFRKDATSDSQWYEWGIRKTDATGGYLYLGDPSGWVAWDSATSKYNYKCLWSPDSRFVAVFIRDTKRSGDTIICSVKDDKIEKIKLPKVDKRIRPHLTAEWRASWVRPELWLPNHELLLTAEGTQMDEEHGVYRFVFGLRLNTGSEEKSVAKIAFFHQDRSIPWSIR